MSDVQSVLEERARIFARPLANARSEATTDVVSFDAAGERFAIEAEFVARIVPAPRIIPLPGTPPYLTGLANVRGYLLPVYDLVRLLGIAPASETAHLVVIGRTNFEFAILAGAVTDLAPLADVPRGGSRGERSIVLRVLADGRTLIDGDALLDDPRLVIGTTAARPPGEDVHR